MRIRSLLLALSTIVALGVTAQPGTVFRTPGEIIWSETFDSTTWSQTVVDDITVIENLPTGWTFTDGNDTSFFWTWSQIGPRGKFSSPNGGVVKVDLTPGAPIQSETLDDGFLLLPSDWYNTNEDGSKVSPSIPMNATIQYGSLDFSQYTAVHFKMQYFFKILHVDNASIKVEFSDDGGASWFTYAIPYRTNMPTLNPTMFDIDLTAELAGKSDCYFRISQEGSTHYFFMIDDISFYQPLDKDLRVENFWPDYTIDGPLGNTSNPNIDFFGSYQNIPLGVAGEFTQFRIAAINFGGISRTGVYADVEIENLSIPQINPVYKNQSDLKSLNIGERDTLSVTTNYKPNNYGLLQFTATITDGEEEDNNKNVAQSNVNITESLYSYTDTTPSSPYSFIDYNYAPEIQGVGQFYYIPNIGTNTVQFNNVGFYVHSQSSSNFSQGDIEVEGRLLKKVGTTYQLLQTTDAYAPQATDLGKFVELTFSNPIDLEGETDYLLLIHATGNLVAYPLKIGRDANHRQSYGRSGVILGAESLTIIPEIPALYANVSGGYLLEETEILSYTIAGQVGASVFDLDNKTIEISMPYDVDITSLAPEFTLSLGATATVNDSLQESGVTEVDFIMPVEYMIQNNTNETLWTVTVLNEPAPQADFIDFSVFAQLGQAIINNDAQTVAVTVAFGTDITGLVPTFTISEGATAFVDTVLQVSEETINDFTQPVIYSIHSSDDLLNKDWTVTVTIADEVEHPGFISFNVPNQLGTTIIDNNSLSIRLVVPVDTDMTQIIPSFTLTAGATAYIGAAVQQSGMSIVNFTNPVIYKVIDGETEAIWTVNISDVMLNGNSILSFSVPNQMGQTVINSKNKTISVAVDNSTDLTILVPTFTLSQGASAFVNDNLQTSGVSVVDFTNQVSYTVVAQSGGEQTWSIKVDHFGDLNAAAQVLSFGFTGQTQPAVINAQTHTITINIAGSQSQTNLIPVFVLSPGATAFIGNSLVTSGGDIVNFSTDVTMKVLAENTLDYQDWAIKVTSNESSQANFETFFVEFDNNGDGVVDTVFNATIFVSNGKIELHLPIGTNVDSLIPKWTTSAGAKVTIGEVLQESGLSVVNMNKTVTYMVTSQSGIDKVWSLITYTDLVGIERNDILAKVMIYPNPATSFINVEVPEDMRNGDYIVYNIYGQTVRTNKYRGLGFEIEIQDLPRGIYFVKISSDRYQIIEKMLFD
ncbi:MAG: T9SS type A sorting domain-containing protein [Salinivirgaceae bacterium]|nr:T9SS type A sorting domain-containing protein [Salinivirgaceae bacterium]